MSPLSGLIRLAGQVKLPVALNPFKTRQPTTSLGRIGKELNPLNPRNAAIMAVTSLIQEVAGRTLDPEGQARVGYMTLGLTPGLALNVLDAGSAGAAPARERQLIEESNRYFANKGLARTQAPAPQRGPRISESTTQEIFQRAVPQQSPRVVPVTPTEPPQPVPINPAALSAAQTGFAAPAEIPLNQFYAAQSQLGSELAESGELQRRLQQTGMVDADLLKWAAANPALAYRELIKREKRPVPTVD